MDEKRPNEIIHGYEIIQSVVFENDRGFALARSQKEGLFVTWQFTEENGKRGYYWGHYIETENKARNDYATRIEDYKKQYRIVDKGNYKYYSTQRPVDIGTFPKTEGGPVHITNFDSREKVEHGRFIAWGYLEYTAPLTEKQISDYELKASFENPDQKRFIEKAQIIGYWEKFYLIPDEKRLTQNPDIVFTPKKHVTEEQLDERYNQAVKATNHVTPPPRRILEQLAEAEKQVQRGAEPPSADKKIKREER